MTDEIISTTNHSGRDGERDFRSKGALIKANLTLPITESENKLLNELVKDCITYRLEEKEAIQYIAIRYKQISL